jgi:hypothetical protein
LIGLLKQIAALRVPRPVDCSRQGKSNRCRHNTRPYGSYIGQTVYVIVIVTFVSPRPQRREDDEETNSRVGLGKGSLTCRGDFALPKISEKINRPTATASGTKQN